MKQFSSPVLYAGLALSLILHLCAAWLGEGRIHPDADYQILEFANFKIGLEPHLTLPWEFFEQIRPAIQPAIAYVVYQVFAEADPFQAAFVLRLISAVLGFVSTLLLCFHAFRWLEQQWAQLALFFVTGFFWLLPFLHAQFASENWAAIFLSLGIWLLLRACDADRKGAIALALVAGVTLGFSFFFRFPVAFALMGLALWLVLVRRPGLLIVAMSLLGFGIAVGLNAVLDAWFYGEWVLTPVNYFSANLIDGKAAQFGIDPWWYYIEKLLILFVPPFSLVLLLAVLAGIIRRPAHVLVWVVTAFLLGHSFIGHKETRFLMPVIYPLLILAVIGLEELGQGLRWQLKKPRLQRPIKIFVYFFVAVNSLALVFFSFTPARQEAVIHKWMYEQGKVGRFELVTYQQDPYHDGGGVISFFRTPNVSPKLVSTPEQWHLLATQASQPIYLFLPTAYPPPTIASSCPDMTLEVSALPGWLRMLDWGQWLSRVDIWSVYRCGAHEANHEVRED